MGAKPQATENFVVIIHREDMPALRVGLLYVASVRRQAVAGDGAVAKVYRPA